MVLFGGGSLAGRIPPIVPSIQNPARSRHRHILNFPNQNLFTCSTGKECSIRSEGDCNYQSVHSHSAFWFAFGASTPYANNAIFTGGRQKALCIAVEFLVVRD